VSGGDATDLNDTGLWLADPAGAISLLVREGDQASGAATGVNFSYIVSFFLNDAGHIAMSGHLRGPGVTTSNRRGIWSSGMPLALLCRLTIFARST